MSLLPSTVSSAANLPGDYYFALKSDIPAAQVLSQNGNTISLSGGGGSVNVASTTAVALSTQKLTAVTYDSGLLETNVDGALNVGLGSAIGSTQVQGGNVIVARADAAASISLVDENTATSASVAYDGTQMTIASTPTILVNSLGGDVNLVGGNQVSLDGGGGGTLTVFGTGIDLNTNYGVRINGGPADVPIGDLNGVQNYLKFNVSDSNSRTTLTNTGASNDYVAQVLGSGVGSTSGVAVKSETGYVKFFNSSNVERATFNYAELTDKITMECVGAGEVALTAGTGGITLSTDAALVLSGAALQSGTSGGSSGQHLRIKLNGVFYKIKLEND